MRRKVIVAVVLVSCVVTGLLLWRDDAQTYTLPDGSRLVLSRVRVGRTNVYLHGSFLSRSIGRFVPSNGLSIAKIKIARPTKVTVNTWSDSNDVLSAQFKLFPASGRADDFLKEPFYRKFRLLVIGDDGFSYVHEFHSPHEFKKYPDGIYAYLHARTWPRTSHHVRIRLEERSSSSHRDFREVATFTVRNPQRVEAERWPVSQPFRTNLPGNVEVEVGELVVREGAIHSSDIWENTAELPVRFTSDGQVLTNWGIHYGPMRDATGNPDWFGAIKVFTNGWTVYRMHRVLDPKCPWRFDVNFALDSSYAETNLFVFDAPWPMSGKISTNFAGLPVTIGYVNTDMLAVGLPGKPPHLRLSFVRAMDDEGKNLAEWSGSWTQHDFWKMLSVRSQKQVSVRATVAIHPNYPASFTLQPRYENAKEASLVRPVSDP
jgi:hypothetical protein